MPSAPSIDLLVNTSSGSLFSKPTVEATCRTPLQPSMAASKLSGSLRSALKILSFSAAPGRPVRKLMSLLLSGHISQIQKHTRIKSRVADDYRNDVLNIVN